MSIAALRRIEQCHEALIAALDGGDLDSLNDRILELRDSIEVAHAHGAWRELPEAQGRAERIIALAEAALMRVNFLTDVTRQRLETVETLRGRPIPSSYGPKGRRPL